MDKEERDRLKRHGDLVVDFANGKNTDRILTDYLENQKTAFNIPHNWKEEFLKQYPTQETFLGFSETEKKAIDYPRILKFHDSIKELQEMLRVILLQISENRNVFETALFKLFLSRYNKIPKKQIVSTNDTELTEVDYPLLVTFEQPLYYSFVEFLKNPEYSGVNRIKKCSLPSCQKFHIRETIKREERYFCSTKCKNDFRNAQRTPGENIKAVSKTRALKKAEKKLSEFVRDVKRMAEAGNNDQEIWAEIQPRIDSEIEYMIKKGFTRRQAENYYKEVCKRPKICKR